MNNPENNIIEYGGNGLKFERNDNDRPHIQDNDDGDFTVFTADNTFVIHKDFIDDVIILLQEVKAHNYKIDY